MNAISRILSNNVTTNVIAVVGVLATIATGVLAWCIFKIGIKKDNKRMISKVGFEFTTEFVIPFSNLLTSLDTILNHPIKEVKLAAVYEIIKGNAILETSKKTRFACWEQYKNDLWHISYSKRWEKGKAIKKYKRMAEFVKLADNVTIGLKTINNSMNLYITKKRNSNNALIDFLKKDDINKYNFKKGIQTLNDTGEAIKNLPEDLMIEETIVRFHGCLDFPKISCDY